LKLTIVVYIHTNKVRELNLVWKYKEE